MSVASEHAEPSSSRPRLVEMALTVQFGGRAIAEDVVLTRFWPRIRDRYPGVMVQPPLPPLREDFGPAPTVSFQLIGPTMPQRFWLVTEDQAELVQVQSDRLATNWRREPSPGTVSGPYPGYEEMRARLWEALTALRAEGPSPSPPMWCELAYVNEIPGAAPDGGRRPLASILRFVNDVQFDWLPGPEDSAFVQRYLLQRANEPVGRLHINANAAFKQATSELVYLVNLTVRAMPPGRDDEHILESMDMAHELVSRMFREAFEDEIRTEWGLE